MPRRNLLPALAIAVAVVAGCSDDDKTAPPRTSESSTSSPPTSGSTTSSLTADPPAWKPTDVFPSGEDAMAHLVEAWRAGDPVTAARVAPPDAIVNLFSAQPDGYAPYQDCGDADFGQQLCAYRNRSQGGFIQFQMEQQDNGWYVISVTVDPAG